MAQENDEVNEFMRELFRERTEGLKREVAERAPFRERFYAEGCHHDNREGSVEGSEREEIVRIESTGSPDLVYVFTTGVNASHEMPLRYHLERMNASVPASTWTWRVREVDFRCTPCQGTGKSEAFNPCMCGGSGWVSVESIKKWRTRWDRRGRRDL